MQKISREQILNTSFQKFRIRKSNNPLCGLSRLSFMSEDYPH